MGFVVADGKRMSKEEVSAVAPYSKSNRKRKSTMRSSTSKPVSARNTKPGKKMKQKMKKLRAQAAEIEAFVEDKKTDMESSRSFVMERQAMLKEVEGVITQIKQQNVLHSRMLLWGELLADHIQNEYNILP